MPAWAVDDRGAGVAGHQYDYVMAGGPHAQVVTTESDAGVPVAPSSWVAEFRWRAAAVDLRVAE